MAVAFLMFKGNAQTSNREQIVNDLNNVAGKALEFYRKPSSMAGGGYTFMGFSLASSDTGNENGSYSVTEKKPHSAKYVPGSIGGITSPTQVIYIIGCGNQMGSDRRDGVKVYARVTADSLVISVLN